jgi:hypothetical protein
VSTVLPENLVAMSNKSLHLSCFVALLMIAGTSGCSLLPGGKVVESATVVYTVGNKKHTAAAQIPVPASTVFSALVKLINESTDVVVVNRNDEAYLLEVTSEGRSFTGQTSSLDATHSLLYVWVDAGNSGQSGEQLAITVVELVCDALGVKYELVHY